MLIVDIQIGVKRVYNVIVLIRKFAMSNFDDRIFKISKSNFFSPDYGAVKEFGVSEFLQNINLLLSQQYVQVLITGEITNFDLRATGAFFSLKDHKDSGILQCYTNPVLYRSLGIALEDGLVVRVLGLPEIYKPQGRFSLLVDHIELSGEGSLKKSYELLKNKLMMEGLFERKRPIPQFIKKIGVVTSLNGAVISDFRNNLKPLGFQIFLCDSRVEGARAVEDLISSIRCCNQKYPNLDVLVIIRGGGSLEDLQAFNNELVIREIFASKIPTICGIGHDKDVPLASIVADIAVSTPTAAANLINNSWQKLELLLPSYERGLASQFEKMLLTQKLKLDRASSVLSLGLKNMSRKYRDYHQFLLNQTLKMDQKVQETWNQTRTSVNNVLEFYEHCLREKSQKLDLIEQFLNEANPERNLKLGYSLITNSLGKVVRSFKDVKLDERVTSRIGDGSFVSKVEMINVKLEDN